MILIEPFPEPLNGSMVYHKASGSHDSPISVGGNLDGFGASGFREDDFRFVGEEVVGGLWVRLRIFGASAQHQGADSDRKTELPERGE